MRNNKYSCSSNNNIIIKISIIINSNISCNNNNIISIIRRFIMHIITVSMQGELKEGKREGERERRS